MTGERDSGAPISPGERFGEYRLLRYFTAGGMADLYLAESPRFGGRKLILKRIQRRYLDHTRVVKMFIDEGRIARLLDHPNVVRVVDIGQVDGNWFIAMEHIHGHDLVAVARRSVEAGVRLPRPIAVGIIAQVAAGLDYAHTRTDDAGEPLHIVHCDVSPGNVVISFRGVAKIVDFGIARATIALREEDGVAGKYNYMAPEQVRGEAFDARADLFPLGVMLHELTVGKRLFRGRPEQVIRKVIEEPIPRPSDLAPGYPPALEGIVMKLLARDPRGRYDSAGDALDDLRSYLVRHEQGWQRADIARFLANLFEAPRSERTDPSAPSALVEDLEVDRGMPETGAPPGSAEPDGDPEVIPLVSVKASNSGRHARVDAGADDDGPTEAVTLPEAPHEPDTTPPVVEPDRTGRQAILDAGLRPAGSASGRIAVVVLVALVVGGALIWLLTR